MKRMMFLFEWIKNFVIAVVDCHKNFAASIKPIKANLVTCVPIDIWEGNGS